MNGGIFTGPQIWQMLSSKELEDKMTVLERDPWQSFRIVVHGFLGRNNAENHKDSAETLLQTYCTASLEAGCQLKCTTCIFTWIFSGQI